jgi:DNA-binding MarR family transcriptional regulator
MASVHQLKPHKKIKASEGALTPVQTKVLGAVARGITGASDLAKELGLTQPRVSTLAAGLIRRGWLSGPNST